MIYKFTLNKTRRPKFCADQQQFPFAKSLTANHI